MKKLPSPVAVLTVHLHRPVTGASRGLGLAAAKAYAQTGASVFLAARSAPLLQQVKEQIETEFKVPVGFASVDVSKDESVKQGIEAAVKQFGRIDIVIANGMTCSCHELCYPY